MGFLEDIKKNIIVADGAMGTLLYSYGIGNCLEELNLSQPDQIKSIHRAYLDAGAQLIQTNTYGANYEKLSRYGLEGQVKEINIAAVQLAKAAINDFNNSGLIGEQEREQKYLFGTIGGIRTVPGKPIPEADIKRVFIEQLSTLLNEGVDGILLETYHDFEELKIVVEIAREETDLPIVAQLSLTDVGIVHGGIPVNDALEKIEELGADVVGLNCRMGPHHMIRSLEKVSILSKAFLSTYPNASLPSYDDGNYHYSANSDYFEESAIHLWKQGVRLIGGCCGTTPDHIRSISRAVKGKKPILTKEMTKNDIPKITHKVVVEKPIFKQNDEDLQEIPKHRDAVIVELDPPKGLQKDKFIEGANALKRAGVDAITLADNSLATPRICNLSMAMILKEKMNTTPLVHITCRDRNLIGLQSHLMGLSTLGIKNLLAITGDPAKVGDFPGATSVYDVSSFEFIQLIKQCNDGISFSGKPLGAKTNFSVAAAFNPNVRHLDQAVRRMEKKIEYGADYFLTQPVYSDEQIRAIYEETKHLTTPIYIGIMPLTGYRNAEFLHHEVPGIKLTDSVRNIMAQHKDDKVASKKEGIAIAKSLIDCALDYFKGIYLITPFMNYEMTVELTEYIREKTGTIIQPQRQLERNAGNGQFIV
ncbi:bifunctional homocysteine S-methyltransferase/methylenetetrahydrofolate reductase [Evansella sp. AB-P1]|uniref:bifunctional homocysteine S-methyltransferase/methylenetetrahydrofolate reductase n=1 Tax=Evansella sp. AB-P1 TaxID=3037653 RepID=UPI00241C03DA|nr:bifunctional homocysteine S-methyltransferase/methylenetetrahydrofolate reductase [Evansella sp. AB-P1]MDG5787830.1 bifunctional homocysteine S-methyltransferase/methylenetetrahydrofolate reductase [Evansella sp. AB-P1]